ncbi:MAG: bifunctional methionine sulfoxide reductase B/A protein [Phycisphaerales bacterium JB039]
MRRLIALAVPALAAFVAGAAILGQTQPENSPVADHIAKTTQQTATDGPVYSRSGYDITPLSQERIDELAKDLTEEERDIILRQGTEPAFCGNLLDNKQEGQYLCRLCQLPLFSSETKFKSGTGWPSFYAPVDREHVGLRKDSSYGMTRVEIVCNRCGGHLGHVFDDAPSTPTGLRFCLNSASLTFLAKGDEPPAGARPVETKTAYFAGGCFWGVEDRFQQIPGVINAVSGYQGGSVDEPGYREVCSGTTGHAETVEVTYDPGRVSYQTLLEWFFKLHNPTTLNRQGPDVGTQYRSAIFAADDEQYAAAKAYIEELQQAPKFKGKPIVTQVQLVSEAGKFWPAEEYHQDYHEKHGGSCPLPDF